MSPSGVTSYSADGSRPEFLSLTQWQREYQLHMRLVQKHVFRQHRWVTHPIPPQFEGGRGDPFSPRQPLQQLLLTYRMHQPYFSSNCGVWGHQVCLVFYTAVGQCYICCSRLEHCDGTISAVCCFAAVQVVEGIFCVAQGDQGPQMQQQH